eukprot:CAMPEP_0201506128 /NCGR_PEP_ID=MMETSP0161_2-20130828/38_1 /ASSEMBLY_ACC=CAM_ASM_000251 /TAXON_ID=180227 /ORGANISM="Neoparamoeba aestuarina, Strain SoJaBio B1-5/56/2" /LENGTH=254 /DNA_ID=CAMNT_0047900131 /DNA_START=71 /DNA_END=833 /DNA_ORIENTATION=+
MNNIGSTGVGDGQNTAAEVLTASRSQINVAPGVVVNLGLGKHGVVLNLGLPEGGSVVGEDDQLGFSLTKRLEGGLVPQVVLSTLHHESETRVNVLLGLFLLLGNHFDMSMGREGKGKEKDEGGNWREVWEKEVEQKATKSVIQSSSSPSFSIVRSLRYTIHFKGLLAKKVYHPVVKCSYSLNGVTTTVWVDGTSKQVFTTEPQKLHSILPSQAKKDGERAGYLAASALRDLDNTSSYNDSCLYLVLPVPKNVGW